MNNRILPFATVGIAVLVMALLIPEQDVTIRQTGHNPNYLKVENEMTVGTLVYHLAKPTNENPSRVRLTEVVDVAATGGNATGVCVYNCGTSGEAHIVLVGNVPCAFDGPTVANDFVQVSDAQAGKCKSVGPLRPTRGKVVGRVRTTNASAGTYEITLFGIGVRGGFSGYQGSVTHDFPSAGGGICNDVSFAVTGAAEGDMVVLSHPASGTRGLFDAWVSTADTVTIRHCSINGVNDPPSATYKVAVLE